MSRSLFRIRPALKKDLPYLKDMVSNEDVMLPDNFLDDAFCAVSRQDLPIGYIKIAKRSDACYVAPVVVYENWRNRGVGKALIRRAYDQYGTLKLVSNGSSNGFYESLDFIETTWEDVDEGFHRDCLKCEFFQRCNPKPYILKK